MLALHARGRGRGQTGRCHGLPLRRRELAGAPVDHDVAADHSQVRDLVERIAREQDGRLDLLVNDIWGGDALIEWKPLWRHDLERGLRLMRLAVETHVSTSHYALALMVRRGRGLVVEVTNGDEGTNALFTDQYRAGASTIWSRRP